MWKEINGFEGYFEVSTDGKVRSVDRSISYIDSKGNLVSKFIRGAEKKLTASKGRDSNGYLVVNLTKEGKRNIKFVHSLVANTFIQNPNNLPTVNHKDGNKHNNNVSNLEWATYSQNNFHALNKGLRNPRGNPIAQYDMSGRLVNTYKSTCEASRVTGITRSSISHCVNGRCNSASGFLWKKLSESQTTIPRGSTQEDELPAEAQRLLYESI